MSPLSITDGKPRIGVANNGSSIVSLQGAGRKMIIPLGISPVHNLKSTLNDSKPFSQITGESAKSVNRLNRLQIKELKRNNNVMPQSISYNDCTSDMLINRLKQVYRLHTGREPDGKKEAFYDIHSYISGKKCLMVQNTRPARLKRAALTLIEQADNKKNQEYYQNNCIIRTKTRNGTPLGYSLLVAGEYVRNPVRGVAENLNAMLFPNHPMSENLVTFTEGANIFKDIVFGVFTGGAYPIAKYFMAKTLTVAGQITEGDATCIKREFSPESLADLLFQNDGISNSNGITKIGAAKSQELIGVQPFSPSAILVQEHLPAHIYTETHLESDINGVIFHIKEISPGRYVAYAVGEDETLATERNIFLTNPLRRGNLQRIARPMPVMTLTWC